MKVLAICFPVADADMESFSRLVPEEAGALRRLKTDGTVTEAWSPGRPGAVLILDVDDLKAAQRVIDELPLVGAGLITTDLIPLLDIGL
jgi:muconolactone delta-isomerase